MTSVPPPKCMLPEVTLCQTEPEIRPKNVPHFLGGHGGHNVGTAFPELQYVGWFLPHLRILEGGIHFYSFYTTNIFSRSKLNLGCERKWHAEVSYGFKASS